MMLGQGRAAAITDDDMAALAVDLGCHPATLEAIAKVESAGFGWFDDGRIKILPEPHKFDDYLPTAKREEALKRGLATASYNATKASGHYKRMTTKAGPRYEFFARMIAFDERAAYMAISVGTYQIMGFNHEVCGYPTAKAMFEGFVESEANQLRSFGLFLSDKGLRGALAREDFDQVELKYNGGGLGGSYAKRMRAEAAALKRGKWSKWPSDWPGKGKAPAQSPQPAPAPAQHAPQPVPTPQPAKAAPVLEPTRNDGTFQAPASEPGPWAQFASFLANLFRRSPK